MLTACSASDWIILILTHLQGHSWQPKTRKAERAGQSGVHLGSPSLNLKILSDNSWHRSLWFYCYNRKCYKTQHWFWKCKSPFIMTLLSVFFINYLHQLWAANSCLWPGTINSAASSCSGGTFHLSLCPRELDWSASARVGQRSRVTVKTQNPRIPEHSTATRSRRRSSRLEEPWCPGCASARCSSCLSWPVSTPPASGS